MPGPVTVDVATPIMSVDVVSENDKESRSEAKTDRKEKLQEKQNKEIEKLCRALDNAALKLQEFHEEVFSSHREQIVELSVRIAEKILLKEIDEGNYDIAKIIQEALKIAPEQRNVAVRLNPRDVEQYEKLVEDKTIEGLSHVEITADAGVGCAQCVVETDKGMVEYFIEEHLNQVARALKGTD